MFEKYNPSKEFNPAEEIKPSNNLNPTKEYKPTNDYKNRSCTTRVTSQESTNVTVGQARRPA